MRPRMAMNLAIAVVFLVVMPACGDDSGQNNNNTVNPCGAGWVLIPDGPFTMGVDEDDPRFAAMQIFGPSNSGPPHPVQMSAYCIQRTEVSVADYRTCVDASACARPEETTEENTFCNYSESAGERERHPVDCVSWDMARTYCQWVGGDLPSEAQWEKAARGGTDERLFPWGDQVPDCSRANYDENGSEVGAGCFNDFSLRTWEVGYLTGTKGDSPYGLKDMSGNVEEWMLDCIAAYSEICPTGSECKDPVYLKDDACTHQVRGGGAHIIGPERIDIVSRLPNSSAEPSLGFRCAKPAP